MGKFVDLTGKRFGRLTVIEIDNSPTTLKQKGTRWKCRCDCGKLHTTFSRNLTTGHTKSCGCLHDDLSAIRITEMNFKHGESNSRIYKIWTDMKKRCNNKNHWAFAEYGGRGISYCEEWGDYIKFKQWAVSSGYSDELTLDRIDVNGNYSSENCRWATRKEQANNKRNNLKFEYNGEIHTLPELSEIYGVSIFALRGRIYRGWDIRKAIETPVREVKKHGA